MNSLLVISIVIVIFAVAYRLYGATMASIFEVDETRKTPAHTRYDGVDFVPSKNWLVLFGHHFASIAGAGPIIGPVIAVCMWGWVPAMIWVVFGSIFLGGIHDFGSLIISVREDGVSIGDVASRSISKKAKLILSIFTWLALILVIAVFAYLGAKTLATQPEIILPSFGIIPVAVLTGVALYRLKWNSFLVTVLSLAVIGILISWGKAMPLNTGAHAQEIWLIVLFIYCFFASVLPVQYLLQPRDYLSSFLLIGGLLAAVIGILVSHPPMNTPAFISTKSPIGYLWPMMFITIACGANSGFHSLIASGTTSKQIEREGHAQRIGFGAMLTEGFLAAIVIVLIVGGFSLDEFNRHVAANTNPINMYGIGFGNMTAPILGDWGTFIALTILNAFILTTLDSATRITRYITEELTGIKNRYVSTGIVLVIGSWLAFGKDSQQNPLWQKIWPAFGASNQLVAALALLVISCWLLGKNKPTRFSLIPAVFMLGTSLSALVIQLAGYLKNRDVLLTAVSIVLIAAAGFLVKEVVIVFLKSRFKHQRNST